MSAGPFRSGKIFTRRRFLQLDSHQRRGSGGPSPYGQVAKAAVSWIGWNGGP